MNNIHTLQREIAEPAVEEPDRPAVLIGHMLAALSGAVVGVILGHLGTVLWAIW